MNTWGIERLKTCLFEKWRYSPKLKLRHGFNKTLLKYGLPFMIGMMLMLSQDPINAGKLGVGFVQSLRGISWLPLFRISFPPSPSETFWHRILSNIIKITFYQTQANLGSVLWVSIYVTCCILMIRMQSCTLRKKTLWENTL